MCLIEIKLPSPWLRCPSLSFKIPEPFFNKIQKYVYSTNQQGWFVTA